MIVFKLADDSMHNVYLSSVERYVNVVRDCYNNYIVSEMIATALWNEYSYPSEGILWCPPCRDEETDEIIPCNFSDNE